MELHKLARLKYQQEEAIKETDEKIQQWEKFRSDYVAVRELLNTLPDKITHDIMVPFGSLAFMPGRLVHTNEILVLLGDNWFVERSAKQAAEIAERRLKETEEQLRKLRMQRKLIEQQIEFTSEFQTIAEKTDGVMDIQEDYDSDKEKEWKAKHRENVKKYRMMSQRHEEPQAANQNTGVNGRLATDAELWARLDELERIEADRNEMTDLGLDEKKSSATGENLSLHTPQRIGGEKRVHWETQSPLEEEVEKNDSLDSDDDADEEKDEEIHSETSSSVRISKTILFTHSKVQPDINAQPDTNAASLQNNPDLPQEGPKIQTPADIRLVTVTSVTKSILKNRDTKPVNLEAAQSVSVKNNLIQTAAKDSTPASSAMAFSEKVLEKDPAVQDLKMDAKPKKMSKFKAQRQSQASR
ncbi:hypothetical protein CHS0354_022551 [Potamilus streckersoni]|uniref:Protein phosphatase 1 regulatory subunit 19 n=1 Tax=Potamilus streckersoni TaxID=2493646 RepID=A0AAE0TBP2_9BIVA|nr:hypothetical protein CHS0354_022551 [Potamilus streckersoni]